MRSYGFFGRAAFLIHFLFVCSFSVFSQPWTTNGPTGKNVKAIMQSPTNPNLLFAGAFGWGVFKSSNGGAGWTNQKTGMTNTYVRSLLSLNDNTVYAGTNDGVFKTTDGGANWSLSLATLNSVRSMGYDPNTGTIYAATFGTGLYKTTNQGAMWSTQTVTDPVSGQTLLHQRAVAVFGRDSLYVGGSITDIDSGGALFRSVSGGSSWIQLQRGIGIRSTVRSIALNPASPTTGLIIGTAALGVYKSTNAGINWSNINGTGVTNPLSDPDVNTVGYTLTQFYAGTDSLDKFYYRGVNDATVGWLAGSGLPGPPVVVNTMWIDGINSSLIYLGTDGKGVYKSSNAGVSWQPLNSGMLGIAGRVVKRNGNGNILLGTEFGDGIWISTNQASSWVKIDSLSTANTITAIAITNNSSVLYAGAYGSGVFKSADGGFQWVLTDTVIISRFARTLAVHPTNQNLVYVGTGNGVFKTDNGGATWLSVNNGIPASTSIRSMAMDRTAPNTVYVGTDSSYMYKTINGGGAWTHITNANGFLPQDIFIRCITIDNTFPSIIYAGADSGRIYKSTNAGSTWTLHNRLASNYSVRAILMHPNDRKIFVGATFGNGIFVSVDSGSHWATFNSGLSDLEIYSLESDNASPMNLYAGTGSSGVFHTTYTYVNAPPVLASIGNQFVLAGDQLLLDISATDANATIPMLSVIGLPSGASFSDSGNGHGRFAWIPTVGQIGTYPLTFIASDGSLADSELVSITVLDSSQSMIANLQEDAGWNLVSVPLVVSDYRKTVLFSTAVSAAYSYHGGYSQRDTLQNGEGYWLKFPSSQIVQIGGNSLVLDSINVDQSWNIIGSLTFPIPVGKVKAVPPLTINSQLYSFSSAGYVVADTVRPGKAYWAKVSQSGIIVLDTATSASNAVPSRASKGEDLQSLGRLSFVDARGQMRSVQLSSDSRIDASRFELPPLPPAGIFDVRFESQRFLAVASGPNVAYPLLIRDAQFPMKVVWDVAPPDGDWVLELCGHSAVRRVALQGRGETVVNENSFASAALRFRPTGAKEVPHEFSLSQNYPNPFNPDTEISYGLPSDGFVTLRIHNVLGQLVASLVDGMQQASNYSVRWTADQVPSGVYYYSIHVTDPATGQLKFRSVKKMLLLK